LAAMAYRHVHRVRRHNAGAVDVDDVMGGSKQPAQKKTHTVVVKSENVVNGESHCPAHAKRFKGLEG